MIVRIRTALGGAVIGVALFMLTTLPSYAQTGSTPSDASDSAMTGTIASAVQRPVQQDTQKTMDSMDSATPMTGTMPMSGTIPMGQAMPMGDVDASQMLAPMMQMMGMMGSQMGMTLPISGTMPMSGTMPIGDAGFAQMMPMMAQMMQMMAGNMSAMPVDGMDPMGGMGAMGGMNNTDMAQRMQMMGMMMQMMGQTMQSMAGPQSMDFAPLVEGLYEGEAVQFLHTEVSDSGIAQILTDMMGPQVVVVSELAETPESLLANVYVFANGLEGGGGPLGFQRDIFDAVPGDENYRPLRSINLVTWQEGSTARELGSVEELNEALAEGEVVIEQPGIVVNMPMMAWPGGQR